jgi:hypothetical protein
MTDTMTSKNTGLSSWDTLYSAERWILRNGIIRDTPLQLQIWVLEVNIDYEDK